jgi:predicted nucleic acid-binding protein
LNHLWHGTSDEIEIPPEVQGITKDSLYIFASADPEAAAKDLEEKKKTREAEQIDEKYRKALGKYSDLRSMWIALREKHSQAEAAKRDPKIPRPDATTLRSLERSVEQSRRILTDSVYFPHKDLLTDEALNGPAVVVPATGLVIKEGMNLILPRGAYGKLDPTPFHVTRVVLPTHKSTAVVAGYWYGTISLLDAGTAETVLSMSAGSLDTAVPTLRGPEEAGQLIVAAFTKEGPSNIGRLPDAFLDANEEALRSALRTWVLETKAEDVALSGEITGWQKDPDGSRYLARVPAFAAMGQAQRGAGVFDAWVGGKADRDRLDAYKERLVTQLARGEKPSPAELSALSVLYQEGTIKRTPMQWVRQGQAEALPQAKFADLWVASARAFGSFEKMDLDRAVADRKWLGAKTTAMQNGQLTWDAYKAAVGDEWAGEVLAAGIAAEASWTELPGIGDSPDVASARLLLRAKQEQLAVAQRYFEIPSEHREPIRVKIPGRDPPVWVEATGLAYTAPEEISQGLARVYHRPPGSNYTQSVAVSLADLGLTRERVEAVVQKAEAAEIRQQEEYRLAAEASEKAKREAADRVLAAKAEKRNALTRALRGKPWSAVDVAAGLEVLAEGAEHKDIIALEHSWEGDTWVRFAFGGTFGKTPRGTKVIKKGGYGSRTLATALIAEGWFWDQTYTNWNAPYDWKATQQRESLAKISLRFDHAKRIAQELSAAGVSLGYLAEQVDTSPEGVAQLLADANKASKSLPAGAPLLPLAGLLGCGPAILVGGKLTAGR